MQGATQEGRDLLDWEPFHRQEWPKTIHHVREYEGGDRLRIDLTVSDLSQRDAKQRLGAWCEALPTMTSVRWLGIWSHVTQPVFDAACQIPGLECLQIKWSNIKALDAIASQKQLKYLYIGSSTKVESVLPLAKLESLKYLHIEHFKKVTDFSPLTALRALEVLVVIGSMWGRQNVGSLDPFTRMTWLRSLALDTTNVSNPRPLAQLSQLEELGIGGKLPLEEYAWLAAKMPNTSCQWFQPYFEVTNLGINRCSRCQGKEQVLLTGKGARLACLNCDSAKVKRHIERYEAAFMAAKESEE